MAWWDFYKLWAYSSEKDPISKKNQRDQLQGAGISQPDMPDIRQDGSFWGGGAQGAIRLMDSNDFVDLSTVTNRQSRLKEYERLRNVAEIEMAMTVIADEACVASKTKIATLFDGLKTIQWLTERWENDQQPFLVYCWDFQKNDYTLGWAHHPRKVKTERTVKVLLDDGNYFLVTPDHRILLSDNNWRCAGDLKHGDELKPFYRLPPNRRYNNLKTNQFPRIFTFDKGWITQQQFLDEWKTGKIDPRKHKVNQLCRILGNGVGLINATDILGHCTHTLRDWLSKEGWTREELDWLHKKPDHRRVIGVMKHLHCEVFDLSVDGHENFCTDSTVMHNCQIGENGHVCNVTCKNDQVKDDLEFLLFHRGMLNIDRKAWQMVKKLCIYGDGFYENIITPEEPKKGVLKIAELPPDSVYRIETVRGKLVEFQQSKEGPDYQALTRSEVTKATEAEMQQATAIRFAPQQVVHFRIGDDRKTFYPYGQSLIEPARGPAHQLRMMEDAMMVYRLCLIGDTRVRTTDGWKYIKDIKVGDLVFSYDVDKEIAVPTKVVYWENTGKDKTYKVKSKHIELIGNATHPVFVERDGIRQYVAIKDLIPKKDKLINVTREDDVQVEIPVIFGQKWAKLDWSQRTAFRNSQYENRSALMKQCIAKNDRVKQFLYAEGKALPYEQAVDVCNIFSLDETKLEIVNKGQINSERINVPKYVDEEFARLFGFLIGDGCIKNKGKILCFAAGMDQKQNEYYALLLKKYFGKVGFSKDKRSKHKFLGNYTVSSQVACRIFLSMGYIPGARNKRIPKWVYTAPKNIRRAFVEGMSDADGCERYTQAGTWFSTIELCNKNLVADIKEAWHSIGLCSGKLGFRKRKGGHEIEPGRKMKTTECYNVTITDYNLPETEKIWSIEEDREQDLFDITVDNSASNFIANGTIVHNSRAPERRVFYIDVGPLPSFKVEAFMERVKDQFRKKKVASGRGGGGANAVEERWHPMPADEDYWLPIRPNSNTRIDTLPGAQNLGEIDDALYFRNKLFTALNFPRNYFNNEDTQATRITLSAQDVKFARMIERIQQHFVDGLMEICERHLELRGYPEEIYEDLQIKMTPPSDWRELSKAEVMNNRISLVTSLKGSMLMADYDLLKIFMKLPEDEVEEIISRNKIQKLEDLKLQIVGQNPQLMGVGVPGNPQGETEVGMEPGGPNPDLAPPQEGGEMPQGQEPQETGPPNNDAPKGKGATLPEPDEDDLKTYDLEMQSYNKDQDSEDIDYSTEI